MITPAYLVVMTVQDLRSRGSNHEGDRVFVMRFWLERAASHDAGALWRAKVTDLNTGEARHANSVDEALDLVRGVMAEAPVTRQSAPR